MITFDKEATFVVDKECKHSRRYNTTDETFPIKSIYVDREYANKKDKLTITITQTE